MGKCFATMITTELLLCMGAQINFEANTASKCFAINIITNGFNSG
jgi:hypothetical protein